LNIINRIAIENCVFKTLKKFNVSWEQDLVIIITVK